MTSPRRTSSGSPRRGKADRAPRPAIEFPSEVEPLAPPPAFFETLDGLGIELEPNEIESLGRYLSLLIKANELVNLTAIREPDEAWVRHIADALTLMPVLAEVEGGTAQRSVIDIGAGGGLPGIPLAIAMPEVRFTLAEPTGKKAAFLEHAVTTLGLRNARVIRERAERLGQDRGRPVNREGRRVREGGHRGAYDLAMCRAVGRLPMVLELLVPLVRVGGLCAFVKGQQADAELEEAKGALHLLHASHAGTVDTPTGRIVVVEKLRETPHTYPRADGEPKRHPLGVRADGASAGASGGAGDGAGTDRG